MYTSMTIESHVIGITASTLNDIHNLLDAFLLCEDPDLPEDKVPLLLALLTLLDGIIPLLLLLSLADEPFSALWESDISLQSVQN